MTFEVSSDEYTTRGRYAVEGEKLLYRGGEAEVYCDGKIRYEIDNRRREVTIDDVDTSSRNLLSNPAHAFDFIGTQYAPLAGERRERPGRRAADPDFGERLARRGRFSLRSILPQCAP